MQKNVQTISDLHNERKVWSVLLLGIVLNFVKNAHKLQTNTKTVRLHSVDASVFVALRRDKVYLRRPNEDGALQKWLSATSTAPHGDVRREIAHNAPPPVRFFTRNGTVTME